MKKYIAILAVVLIISICVLALVACNSDELVLYVPDGAPALSVSKIISDGALGDNRVKTVVTTGEDVVSKCASGEADMAVLPTNSAVTICAQRKDYLLVSVNVYGVLYIVGREHIDTIAELQGQTLYSIGLGNTPQFVFKEICAEQGVNYDAINVNFQADATTIIPQILNGSAKFALLGEPAVTQLKNKAQGQGVEIETLFDLQEEWQKSTGSEQKGYPQASMIVKKNLLTDDFASKLYATLQQNYEFVTSNCAQLNGLMRNAGSLLDLNYTTELLERCNLTIIPAQDAKADIERYLSTFEAMANLLPIADDLIYETKD